MPNSPSNWAETLGFAHRIALSYAPQSARPAWLAMFMLDEKLQDTARPGREHLMIQLRLSWWRDRLRESEDKWPVSEPVLTSLKAWQGRHDALVALVDGWEAEALDGPGSPLLDAARVEANVALAQLLDVTDLDAVRHAAGGNGVSGKLARTTPRLPRSMRPMLVLRALESGADGSGFVEAAVTLGRILKAGLLGR